MPVAALSVAEQREKCWCHLGLGNVGGREVGTRDTICGTLCVPF